MKKTIGIILVVFSLVAIVGSYANGTFETFGQNVMRDIGFFAAFFAMFLGGLALINKSKKK